MTKWEFEYELRKNEILDILDNAKEPMTAKEISNYLYMMTTAKTSCYLHRLYNEGLVYKNNTEKKNIYWTQRTRKHKKDNNTYPFYYNLYRRLINFIKERKPNVE